MSEPRTTEPPRRVRPCPICGKPAEGPDRPFCSRRCADVDLHRWLGGRYAIPANETPEDDDEAVGRIPPDQSSLD